MKQILQSLKNGSTAIADVPMPQVKNKHLLIETHCSLISPGTEKMLLAFGEGSLLEKARQQPDKVRMVINKIKTDGLLPTLSAVQHKLDQLIPMGYANVGTVIAVGNDCAGFAVGDRVVSNGPHAEIVSVPKNLCCKIPPEVTDEAAVFTILGAIALQGIRLTAPCIGETFAVIGLGLIGLLTIQLLRAHGCRVLGFDLDDDKIQLARAFGAISFKIAEGIDVDALAKKYTQGRGVDGALITCATKSHAPIQQAAAMCRKRGRITLIGVTGLQLSRADFYEKELKFQVSCAYGPGRYDIQYEQQGHDYPYPYVRFTAQRNFEAFLDLLAMRSIDVSTLITHRYAINQADVAYAKLTEDPHIIGMILSYPRNTHDTALHAREITLAHTTSTTSGQQQQTAKHAVKLAVIGAGNYASRLLIPAFNKTPATIVTVACENGVSGYQVAKHFAIPKVTSDVATIWQDNVINAVVIATRHDTHAAFVLSALQAGKHVFVEKPLCLTAEEVTAIEAAKAKHPETMLMIGFNRRFAPLTQKIKTLLATVVEPKSFIMTVNAGAILADHWTQQPSLGGGRIIGEACHFIDLLRYLANAHITDWQVISLGNVAIATDKVSINLSFADGSFGVIHYLANGHSSFPKERLEIFAGGRVLQLDNFRRLIGFGWSNFKKQTLWRQDKGQQQCAHAFIHAIQHNLPSPIPTAEIFEIARVTIAIAEDVKARP